MKNFVLLVTFVLTALGCVSKVVNPDFNATTETEGSFRITKKLPYGKYELRILDKRYRGSMPIDLEERPAREIIFLVTRQ